MGKWRLAGVQNANWQFISMEVLANLTRKVNNNNKIVVIINLKKTLPESRQQGLQRKLLSSHQKVRFSAATPGSRLELKTGQSHCLQLALYLPQTLPGGSH